MLTVYAARSWYVMVYSVIQSSPFPRIRLTWKPDGLPGGRALIPRNASGCLTLCGFLHLRPIPLHSWDAFFAPRLFLPGRMVGPFSSPFF